MEKSMEAVKKDGPDTRCTLNSTRSKRSKDYARKRESRTITVSRSQLKIGLNERQVSYAAFYKFLETFALENWKALPSNASSWERGQVDGLFWALDKLDELIGE